MQSTDEKKCNTCKPHEGSCTRVKTVEDYKLEQELDNEVNETPYNSPVAGSVWAPVWMMYPYDVGCKM